MSPAKKKRDWGLIIAIVFAALVVSGSLIFFALQFAGGGKMNDEDFSVMLDKYVASKEAEQVAKQQETVEDGIRNSASEAQKVAAITEQDHVFGSKDSKITLIEYSDFQCPYCTNFHSTAKQIIDQYGGDVNWVYRHYPLSFHEPAATKQAKASECVADIGGNAAFWEFGDLMFKDGYQGDDALTALAAQVGVSESDFESCFNSTRFDDKIAADAANATDVGVTGTPGNILLNNETGEAYRIDGAQGIDLFKTFIDEMLAS